MTIYAEQEMGRIPEYLQLLLKYFSPMIAVPKSTRREDWKIAKLAIALACHMKLLSKESFFLNFLQ